MCGPRHGAVLHSTEAWKFIFPDKRNSRENRERHAVPCSTILRVELLFPALL